MALPDHAERDEPVHPRVVAVGDQGGTGEALPGAQAHLGGDLVADKADHPRCREHPQVSEVLWVDEPEDRFIEGHAGRHEDDEDNEQSGELLNAE